MLNIVSVAPGWRGWSGASKVYWNLVKGLRMIGYPYVVNRDLRATRRLWVQSDVFALPGLRRTHAKVVLGPNLFVLPSDIPRGVDLDGAIYLQPSEWYAALWRHAGFRECELAVWPVGIDTEAFPARPAPRPRGRVLVYYKLRPAADLQHVCDELDRSRLPYRILQFGTYAERAYRDLLAETSFVVWVGRHESQGIALQEALASDVPVLVWDVTRLGQCQPPDYAFGPMLQDFPATSAPYFDQTCGLKITSPGELRDAIAQVSERLSTFAPRAFVLQHLSLERQARALIDLWERWGLGFDQGLTERAATDEPLRYRPLEMLNFRWQRRFGPHLR